MSQSTALRAQIQVFVRGEAVPPRKSRKLKKKQNTGNEDVESCWLGQSYFSSAYSTTAIPTEDVCIGRSDETKPAKPTDADVNRSNAPIPATKPSVLPGYDVLHQAFSFSFNCELLLECNLGLLIAANVKSAM